MNIKKFYIYSECEMLVKLNGKKIGIVGDRTLPLETNLDIGQDNIFEVYPIDNCENKGIKLLPYLFKIIKSGDSIVCSSDYVEFITYNNDIFDLLLKENLLETYNKNQIKHINISQDIYASFSKISDCLIIKNKAQQFEFDITYNIENAIISNATFNQSQYLALQGKVQEYDYLSLFIVTNDSVKRICEFLADKIEIQNDEIHTITKKRDMAKRAIVSVYQVGSEKVTRKEKYLSSLTKETKIIKDEALIPYVFLEAVQSEDFDEARKYLSSELNTALSDTHLKKYFGNFCEIKQPHNFEKNKVALIYKIQNNYIAKYCNFSFLNNKIDNIDLE